MTPKEHWRRDKPSFYNLFELDRAPIDAPEPLGGLTGALMSWDTNSDARTFIVELPIGWSAAFDGTGASLELFLLRGDVALEGSAVGSSGYVHLPQNGGGGELRSTRGALAIAWWNPNIPAFPPPFTQNRVTKAWQEPWTPSLPGSHGIMHKSLRLPDPVPHPDHEGFDGGPGGYIRYQYIPPSWVAPEEHVHHECFEEIILLQGDALLINEGIQGIGSVVSHPQEWYHAPFVTRSGQLILVHTDAPMGYPWPPRPYPQALEIAAAYLDSAPFDEPTRHVPWDQSHLAELQDTPEYRAWRQTPEGALWGDRVGRGVSSEFRGSWRREP